MHDFCSNLLPSDSLLVAEPKLARFAWSGKRKSPAKALSMLRIRPYEHTLEVYLATAYEPLLGKLFIVRMALLDLEYHKRGACCCSAGHARRLQKGKESILEPFQYPIADATRSYSSSCPCGISVHLISNKQINLWECLTSLKKKHPNHATLYALEEL